MLDNEEAEIKAHRESLEHGLMIVESLKRIESRIGEIAGMLDAMNQLVDDASGLNESDAAAFKELIGLTRQSLVDVMGFDDRNAEAA